MQSLVERLNLFFIERIALSVFHGYGLMVDGDKQEFPIMKAHRLAETLMYWFKLASSLVELSTGPRDSRAAANTPMQAQENCLYDRNWRNRRRSRAPYASQTAIVAESLGTSSDTVSRVQYTAPIASELERIRNPIDSNRRLIEVRSNREGRKGKKPPIFFCLRLRLWRRYMPEVRANMPKVP